MTDVGIDEARVLEATGFPRSHWYAMMDAYGAVDHAARARQLRSDAPDLDPWWVQTLSVDYERARGMREVGQSSTGDFQVSCSKTVAMGSEEAYEQIVATPFLAGARWLEGSTWETEGARVEVRRADPGKMLRWFWHADEKSTVEIHFTARSDKTTVTIRHHGLPSKEAREAYRTKWKAALKRIYE